MSTVLPEHAEAGGILIARLRDVRDKMPNDRLADGEFYLLVEATISDGLTDAVQRFIKLLSAMLGSKEITLSDKQRASLETHISIGMRALELRGPRGPLAGLDV